MFLRSVKKVIAGDKQKFLNFEGVEFITYKTIGVEDFLMFKYKDVVFDKIVEYNGFYVIKFKANVDINGKDILEDHKVAELELKYELKAKK